MKTTDKKIKVEFAPGAFDDFEGTQEELDQLQEELLTLFSELTPEELSLRSMPVDLDALSAEDPDVAEKIANFLGDDATRVLQ